MWRRAALWVAGLAGITVCAARAEEMTHVAIPEAPQGSYVCYLDDDPPTAQAAAGRVLRLLEILGVHDPKQPHQLPATTGTKMDLPAPPAADAGPLETAGPVAFQDAARTSEDDGRTSPLVAASPHFFMSRKNRASSWPISNDLRDPAKTRTSLYQAEGNRETREQGFAAAAERSESAPSPASPVASPAASPTRPVAPINCPEGMTSSRRTIQLAADSTKAAQAPGAELHAANKVPAMAPAITPAITPATAAPPAPAIFYPNPQSAKSMASLPPLTPLRTDSVSIQPPARGNEAPGKGILSSQPMPAPAPSVRNANADGCIYSTAETHGTTPLSADSDGLCFEPRSADAVLEPRAVPVAKTPLAGRHGADAGLTKIPVNVECVRMAMPSLKRRSVLPPAPELPLQRVATSRRRSSSVWGGTARWAMLPQLPNTLRDLPQAPAADLPRQIAQQSLPKSAPLSPSLPARQSQPQLPPKLPPLHPRHSEALVATAEPALLRVAVRESRLLRTSENVVRVFSEHDSVCDVLLFNPREIAVIGKQQGTAKVEFWYDGQGLNRASYLVSVDDRQNPEARQEADLQKVEQLVGYLFPKSRVKLVSDQDQLIVRGTAINRREAVEIISTVRRSQLIPVADEIVVQSEAR